MAVVGVAGLSLHPMALLPGHCYRHGLRRPARRADAGAGPGRLLGSLPRTRHGNPHAAESHSVKTSAVARSEEHTSELQSRGHLVCRLLLEKKKQKTSR